MKTRQTTNLLRLAKGFRLQQGFFSEQQCQYILELIQNYQNHHAITKIHRPTGGRSLDYSVINGEQIKAYLPEIWDLYRKMNHLVNLLTGEKLVPLKDEKVGCNINITSQGGAYRWHYDRNAVTAILYLNRVRGGEIECYPNYRIFLPSLRYSRLQRWLDGILQLGVVRHTFGKGILVKPEPGTLLIMRGNQCLHSVCPVIGQNDRKNIVMAFDRPEAKFAVATKLDTYLYSQTSISSAEPNYI